MITWGVSANSHDAALAVFDDDKIVFASHAERFSGVKNDPHLNKPIIEYALKYGYPEEIQWYENPFLKSLRQLRAGQGFRFSENNVKDYMSQFNIYTTVKTQSHHHSHAAAGYYTSGFDDATVVVMDAIGEFETYTVWEGKGDNLKKIYSQSYPHSLGLWYSAMTQRIGLKPNEEEYILMGMAAYGDHYKYYKDVEDTFFKPVIDHTFKLRHNLHRGCLWYKSQMDAYDHKHQPSQWAYDIAAATQRVYEDKLYDLMLDIKQKGSSKNLVFMGGCALNCKANTYIKDLWDNIWIMPNPGDAGSAIGAVLADRKKHIDWQGPYLGYDIGGQYNVEKIVDEIISRGLVGVAKGPAEFGPRALGNRSLLADPRTLDIKAKVNDIKQRQRFRPFAPAILEEHADKYFKGPKNESMQFTSRCLEPKEFPAIVHYDGTSRVQTVTKENNENFRLLLEHWYAKTGCPILLNTSLNIKGKPMVNDRYDALEWEKKYGVKVL